MVYHDLLPSVQSDVWVSGDVTTLVSFFDGGGRGFDAGLLVREGGSIPGT